MTTRAARPLFTHRRYLVFAIAVAMALAGAGAWLSAQTAQPVRAQAAAPAAAQAAAPAAAKKALTIDDYTKWRSIAGQEMSGDGKWLVYTLALTNTIAAEAKPVLHLLNLETGADVTVNDATDADFSPDSTWIAYQVDPGRRAARARGPERGRRIRRVRHDAAGRRRGGAAGGAPADRSVGRSPVSRARRASPAAAARRRRFRRGASSCGTWRPARSARGRTSGRSPSRRRRRISSCAGARPTRPAARAGAAAGRPAVPGGQGGGRGGGATTPTGQGNDALLLDLRTGGHQLLGSVAEIAFNRTGELLAFTVNAAVKDGDGVFVFDTRNGRTTVLDNDAKMYSRLQWNEAGTGLAVLKGNDVEKMRERDNVLLAFPDITAALKDGAAAAVPVVLDPAKADGLPQGLGRQRPRGARVERGQRARLLRRQGAGAGGGHDPQVPGRGGERRRVEHGGRARAVAPDDPREPGPQLHLPQRVRREGEPVRQARRRDHEGPRRRAGRHVGRGPGRARVPRRPEEAAGRRLLPREHADGRADAHREGPAHRPPRVRHLAARHALPLLEGRQGPGLRPQREHDARARRHGGAELRRHGRRPPGHEAVLRRRRLRERRQGGHREPPVRPVAAAARRLGRDQPDRRPRHEERDALPPRPDRAGRSDAAARRRPARDVRPDEAPHAVGVRPVDEEGRLLRAGRRADEGARLRGRVVQHAGQGDEGRPVPVHAPDVRRVPRPARLGPGLRGRRRRSPTPTRSRRTSCGATGSCSTTRTRTASGCRASSRFPTTTSRARSGR